MKVEVGGVGVSGEWGVLGFLKWGFWVSFEVRGVFIFIFLKVRG